MRAAAILVVAFLGTFGVMAFLLLRPDELHSPGMGQLSAMILGVLLAVVGGLSLLGIGVSGRLKRGVQGALVAVLAVPFVFLVIIAGLCVVTTNGLSI